MDKFKQQIQQRLVANIIIDKCVHCEHLVFRDAWCTQERVLRFTTPFFREYFSYEESEKGRWKTGDCVMYEIQNGINALTVTCVLSLFLPKAEAYSALLRAAEAHEMVAPSEVVLKSWELSSSDGNVNRLMEAFDDLIRKEIPDWEQGLRKKLSADPAALPIMKEGASESISLNKYERNPKARAACLSAHGTACTVCGIDFAKAYGPEFAGKIEVHHIVPIHLIGTEYTVDPVKDLVPVCPNCHTALHSKKDGIYTVEDLKAIRAANN